MTNFEWGRMQNTPEGKIGKEQVRRRSANETIEGLARGYDSQAKEVLSGEDGAVARDEISRFAKKISTATESEREDYLELLINALRIRRPSFFEDIPDEGKERSAFAMALVSTYIRELQ